MTTLLIGADGQLGSELRQAFRDHDLVPLTHADLELTDRDQVTDTLRTRRPALVLNTAAYHRVDECEDFPDRAFAVNALAVRDLAVAAGAVGAVLVHFSTDYVFDGRQRRPYQETDAPGPLSVYATSKLAGEHFVRAASDRHLVIRTCGLYGLAGRQSKAGNFVETMLRLAIEGRQIRVVGDQIVTPTSAKELARKVRQLVEAGGSGLYHITNHGGCSWYRFAAAIFELSGIRPNLSETTSTAFGARAVRPSYSVLENSRLGRLGLDDMSPWQEALKAYLEDRRASKSVS
ncbi:MAG: dTDP-4-dehydrorhamnose reductase [Candidatus Methylomirabilis oxyfera]|nr:dTDP-4-dehydrorhamnose reductase [Candidatus Methylomirabilis oxyfera]